VKGESRIGNVRSQNSCSFQVPRSTIADLRFQFSSPPSREGKGRCGAVKKAGMGSERDHFLKSQVTSPCQLFSSTEMEENRKWKMERHKDSKLRNWRTSRQQSPISLQLSPGFWIKCLLDSRIRGNDESNEWDYEGQKTLDTTMSA
jgi:hypothetical protein